MAPAVRPALWRLLRSDPLSDCRTTAPNSNCWMTRLSHRRWPCRPPADKPSAVTKSKTTVAKAGSPGRTGQKGAKGRGNRVNAHERRSPQTLEETLEILGADELQIEGARKELISEGPVRHLDVKVQKNSPFSRLLDRLAERGR